MVDFTKQALKNLAYNEDYYGRLVAAESPNTPKSALASLSFDESPEIRVAVAENSNTSLQTLERLANDESLGVRQSAKDSLLRRDKTWKIKNDN